MGNVGVVFKVPMMNAIVGIGLQPQMSFNSQALLRGSVKASEVNSSWKSGTINFIASQANQNQIVFRADCFLSGVPRVPVMSIVEVPTMLLPIMVAQAVHLTNKIVVNTSAASMVGADALKIAEVNGAGNIEKELTAEQAKVGIHHSRDIACKIMVAAVNNLTTLGNN